ncbi:hypothetical protein [Alkalihalobacillus sp. LMS39]|nr:hypothetical protein [Alkalihalobacillus sp. LMS39]UOE96424.1 hypothetical protein MM271_13080 [Alkalihalobacillus sp. LMS39]
MQSVILKTYTPGLYTSIFFSYSVYPYFN